MMQDAALARATENVLAGRCVVCEASGTVQAGGLVCPTELCTSRFVGLPPSILEPLWALAWKIRCARSVLAWECLWCEEPEELVCSCRSHSGVTQRQLPMDMLQHLQDVRMMEWPGGFLNPPENDKRLEWLRLAIARDD